MPSTVIRTAHYDPDRRMLDILFTTGRRYLYREVPPDEADRFRAAFSKGRYFNAHIRDRYDFSEIAGA
jgi:lysyl-tRNA synthetase class 2